MYIRISVRKVKSDERDFYRAALAEQSRKVLELEPRTRNYYFLQDQNDPDIFFIIAMFQDRAAHEHHINTPHLKQYLQQLRSHGIKPEQIGKWEAVNLVPDDASSPE